MMFFKRDVTKIRGKVFKITSFLPDNRDSKYSRIQMYGKMYNSVNLHYLYNNKLQKWLRTAYGT